MTSSDPFQPQPVCESVILSKQRGMMGLRGGEKSTAGLSQEQAALQFGLRGAAGEKAACAHAGSTCPPQVLGAKV